MSVFKTQKPNLESVVQSLLKDLGVKANSKTITNNLQDHPEYPSLLSISDCLMDFNVHNQAYNIAREDYDPEDLLFPFVAHLKGRNNRFILIHKITKGSVIFSDEKHNHSELPENSFLDNWDGIVLHGIKNELSGEKTFLRNRIKYLFKKYLVAIPIMLLGMLLYLILRDRGFFLSLEILLFVKLAGITVSLLLIVQSLNSDNVFIKKLCGFYKKSDCNGILDSEAAKIFDWLSWSEVGFFYFLITVCLLIFIPNSILSIKLLNILCLPYTLYSIGYQYRTKKWCILCCTVQVLLWVEFSLISVIDSNSNFFNSSYYLAVCLCFLIPIILWVFLKPLIVSSFELKTVKQQLKKFKANDELFYNQLHKQPRYLINEDLMPISLGNHSAETIITIVSNPFCKPCLKAHKTLHELLSKGKDFQLKILLANGKSDDQYKKNVGMHLRSLVGIDNKMFIESALNDWYSKSNQNFDKWQKKYSTVIIDQIDVVQKKQREWFSIAEISYTPTIFINGYKLPEIYTVDDLINIL